MAGFVSALDSGHLLGLCTIFQFTNEDGRLVRSNCAQAAAATFLTHYGKIFKPDVPSAKGTRANTPTAAMSFLETRFPPDQIGGLFGTSRRRVIQICKAFGLGVRDIRGEGAVVASLNRRKPVIVMLGVSAGKFLGYDLPGGHWMVAYACDGANVYLTNWGEMTWNQFHRGWNSIVPSLIQMRNRGLVADDSSYD
ncbi:MAG: hypothetical protein HY040_28355 [Planctomycetes bacterium]|nr:hypothetical protein [Planctomycetota bacterium]